MDRYWFQEERISAAIHKPGSFKLLAVDYLRGKKKLYLNNNNNKKVRLYCLEWQAEFLFPGSRPEGLPDHGEGWVCLLSPPTPRNLPLREAGMSSSPCCGSLVNGEADNSLAAQLYLKQKHRFRGVQKLAPWWNKNRSSIHYCSLFNRSSLTSRVSVRRARTPNLEHAWQNTARPAFYNSPAW